MTAALFLQYLPYLLEAAQQIPKIYELISTIKADLKSKPDGWTSADEQAFKDSLAKMGADPAWIEAAGVTDPPIK